MGIHAFLSGANAVCFLKNKHKYAMICAWATMIDYDVVGLLIGEQSVTGKNLEVGMMIGVSALSKEQKDIAITLGNNHSDEIDKLASVPHETDGTAILIKNAKNNLVCKIENIMRLNAENDDLFVVAKFVRAKEDKTKDFLEAEEVFR